MPEGRRSFHIAETAEGEMGAAEGQGTRTADAQRSESAGRRVKRRDGGCSDSLQGTETGSLGGRPAKERRRGARPTVLLKISLHCKCMTEIFRIFVLKQE